MPSARRTWGYALTAIPVLFLAFDATIKLIEIDPVKESMAALGYPDHLARGLGLLELLCVGLTLLPRTAVLGAVLLTGYFGGAVASHLRVGDPLLSHTIFPVYIGAMVWIGLALRRPELLAVALGRSRG